MMELERTAPDKIYLVVGDIENICNFNELTDVSWCEDSVYPQTDIRYIKQPRLTIPKWVADIAKYNGFAYEKTFKYITSGSKLGDWLCKKYSRELVQAYCNPLTRELVEVVDD